MEQTKSESESGVQTESQFVIVDEHRLRGAALESLFSKWAEKEGLKINRVSSFEKIVRQEGVNFEICLLSLGGMSLSDAASWQVFCELKRKWWEIPLVVMLDAGTIADVRLAYLAGARGVIHTNMTTQVVVAALSFVLSGGEYFPPIGWRESVKENVQGSPAGWNGDPITEPSEITDRIRGLSIGFPAPRVGSDGPCEPPVNPMIVLGAEEPTSNERCFTTRQDDVPDLLKLGYSNKEIPRTLNLSESTVKIHVRQLMKKMGVANRTQVALRAMRAEHERPEH